MTIDVWCRKPTLLQFREFRYKASYLILRNPQLAQAVANSGARREAGASITWKGLLMAALTTRELAALVGGDLQGDSQGVIQDVASVEQAGPAHVTFAEGAAAVEQLRGRSVGAVLVAQTDRDASSSCHVPLIFVDDPQAAFVEAMLHFRPAPTTPQIGISPQAVVASNARFGTDCVVFPGATIGEDVVCGDRCVIHPGAYIGSGCRLGDDVTIHPNAVLYSGVSLGDRVLVHATAVIGADGFGFRFAQGRFHKLPHTGRVLVESDVEIGAGTTIDRGMIEDTVIGEGTKLDNQVMIAHNCRIGRHNAFASQVGLAGSTTSGDYVRCGGQAGISDHSHLGTGCSIGAKAGLYGTVPDGADYHGYPAGPAKEQYRIVMTVQKLPEMRKQLRALADEVRELKSQLHAASSENTDGRSHEARRAA